MPFATSQAMPLQSTVQSPKGQKRSLQFETADSVSSIQRTFFRIASYANSAVSFIVPASRRVNGTVGVMQLMIADAQLDPCLPLLSRLYPLPGSTRELRE